MSEEEARRLARGWCLTLEKLQRPKTLDRGRPFLRVLR